MTNERMEHVLLHITGAAYPGTLIPAFTVQLIADETTDANGSYEIATQTIRIYHLLRPGTDILATALHEMSHHLRAMMEGKAAGEKHDTAFYRTMNELLGSAVALGYMTAQQVQDIEDTDSYHEMWKRYGPIRTTYAMAGRINDKYVVFYVRNPRDRTLNARLKQEGFKYNPLEQQWEADMEKEKADPLMALLQRSFGNVIMFMKPVTEIFVDPVYRVIVESGRESYIHREDLKRDGYFFSHTRNAWQKDVRGSSLKETKNALMNIGLTYTIIGTHEALLQEGGAYAARRTSNA